MSLKTYAVQLIEPGKHVAYNLSGMVAYGEVVDVRPSKRYNRNGWTIHIRRIFPEKYGSSAVSKNNKSLQLFGYRKREKMTAKIGRDYQITVDVYFKDVESGVDVSHETFSGMLNTQHHSNHHFDVHHKLPSDITKMFNSIREDNVTDELIERISGDRKLAYKLLEAMNKYDREKTEEREEY